MESIGDTDHKGWTGSCEIEVNGPELEEAIDALIANNLGRVNADDVTILRTNFYRGGTQRAVVYSGVQMKFSQEAPGMHDKVTQKFDWQADSRQPV